jgi:hypothetical protein
MSTIQELQEENSSLRLAFHELQLAYDDALKHRSPVPGRAQSIRETNTRLARENELLRDQVQRLTEGSIRRGLDRDTHSFVEWGNEIRKHEQTREKLEALISAVTIHRNASFGNSNCHQNDLNLWQAAGIEPIDRQLPPECEFKEQCEAYRRALYASVKASGPDQGQTGQSGASEPDSIPPEQLPQPSAPPVAGETPAAAPSVSWLEDKIRHLERQLHAANSLGLTATYERDKLQADVVNLDKQLIQQQEINAQHRIEIEARGRAIETLLRRCCEIDYEKAVTISVDHEATANYFNLKIGDFFIYGTRHDRNTDHDPLLESRRKHFIEALKIAPRGPCVHQGWLDEAKQIIPELIKHAKHAEFPQGDPPCIETAQSFLRSIS